MPSCNSCRRDFPDRRHFYCDLCRCIEAGCEYLRDRPEARCRSHRGLCANSACTNRIVRPKRFCNTCEAARQRSAPPSAGIDLKHIAPGTDVKGLAAAGDLKVNLERKAALHADELRSSPSYREHIQTVLAALAEIGRNRTFNDYLDSLVGWKNLRSWARWVGRSIEPAMLKRMRFEAIIGVLTPQMQAAGMRRAYFAEKFLEEMILVCKDEISRADVSFIVGQAFTLFGVVLAPFSMMAGQAAGAGIGGTATSGAISFGKQLAQMGTNAGANAAFGRDVGPVTMHADEKGSVGDVTGFGVVARSRSNAVSAPPPELKESKAEIENRYHYSVNPMQYAVSLFKYLTNLRSPGRAESIVIREFGGARNLAYLYEMIKHPPE